MSAGAAAAPAADRIDRSAKGTVWNLQVLRFAAAAMVLLSHLNHEVTQRSGMAAGFVPFAPIWWPGGVDVFFVISGFIMYYISADAFGRPGASRHFVERRLLRLVPPYWFFTLLALGAMLALPGQMARNGVTPFQVIGSFLFVPAAGPDGKAFPVLILGWTLNFEMLFYAIFAIGLLLRKPVGLALIGVALILIAAASLAQPLSLPLGFWCNNIVLEFLFGIGLSMAHRQGVRLPMAGGVGLVGLGVLALLAVQAAGWPGAAWNWRFLWAGLPSALICAGVVLVPERARPGPVRRFFVYLGDTSYALYLSHPFVLSVVAMIWGRLGLRDPWLYIGLSFAACLIGAALFFSLIEKPVHRWLTRRIDGRRNARVAHAGGQG